MTLTTPRFGFPYPEDTDAPNGPGQIQALAEAIEAVLTPAGSILATARSTAPSGYLLCDGSSVQRSTYADLFAAIGTAYGSVDGTHFNLPDLRGRVPVGVDGGAERILTNDELGSSGGEEKHTLTTPEIPAHTHPIPLATGGGAGAIHGTTSATDFYGNDTSGSTGGGGSHNNMQPFQIVNYLIKI